MYKEENSWRPPTEFALEQNFPNPFNMTTTITFAVPQAAMASPVLLEVFDVLGRAVTTLVQNQLSGGVYRIQWAAGPLASGIYLCRLTTGSSVLTKKMFLVR